MSTQTENILKKKISNNSDCFLPDMPIGGMTPFTTIDFPGMLACVLYTQGCPWRCVYCHNHSLWNRDDKIKLSNEEIFEFLKKRKNLLEGVVISGGEPTMHGSLNEFIQQIRLMGFKVALHTNGMFPKNLKKVIGSCDWVAMDIKAKLQNYDEITQKDHSYEFVLESMQIVLNSKINYEFRTTVHPKLFTEQDIEAIIKFLASFNVKNYAVQLFHADGCINEELKNSNKRRYLSKSFKSKMARFIPNIIWRNF